MSVVESINLRQLDRASLLIRLPNAAIGGSRYRAQAISWPGDGIVSHPGRRTKAGHPPIRSQVTLQEEVQRQVARDGLRRADRDRVRIPVVAARRAPAAEDLDALVVAVDRLSAVLDGANRAIL